MADASADSTAATAAAPPPAPRTPATTAPSQLEQLGALPIELILLKLSNPGPLLATCRATYRAGKGLQVALAWFCRWAHVLVPYRPWQYSLITWRRLATWRPSGLAGAHGRIFELVHFMTLVIARREHERLQRLQQGLCRSAESQLLLELQQLQVCEGQSMQQQQQQQQQHQRPNFPKPGPKQQREQFSPFPECLPLPSLVKQAQQHLHRGRGTKALQLLCPGPPLLLYAYASLAGDLQLLVQLVQDQSDDMNAPYPDQTLMLSCHNDFRFKTAQLCCHGAMRAGSAAVLAWVLKTANPSFRDDPYMMYQLLRFAVQHSDSTCLQELLEFLSCTFMDAAWPRGPWHQHLAMAAGRTDPWAARVVQLLLKVLGPKQTAAKYMGAAYEAAARSGHLPVLQQLLAVAAANPSRHVWVLLHAAVRAGNVGLLQQLLQQEPDAAASGSSSSSPSGSASGGGRPSSSGSIQDSGVMQSQQVPRPLVPQLPLANLAASQWAVLLLCALDGQENSNSTAPFTEARRLDSRQEALADAVWAAVGRQPSLAQQQVQLLLRCGVVIVEDLPGLPDREWTAELLHVCAEAKPGKLLWLHWHGLLPLPPPGAYADGAPERVPGLKDRLHSMLMKLWVSRQLRGLSVVINFARQLGVELAPVSVCVTATMAAAVSDAASRGDAQGVWHLSAAQEFLRRALKLCASVPWGTWLARTQLGRWHDGAGFALINSGGSGIQQAGSPSAAAGTAEPAASGADASSSSEGNSLGSGPAASTTGRVLPLWLLAAVALTHSIAPADANGPYMFGAVMSPGVNSAIGSVTAAGTPPGATKQEQALLKSLLYAVLPSQTQQPAFVWLMTDLLQHRLDVLAWALHPTQKATLWAGSAAGEQLAMHVGGCSQRALNGPRWSPRSSIERHLEQQQARQLEQHTQERAAGVAEGFPPLPHFAAGAVDLCGALLLQPQLPDWSGQLGTNILEDVSAASSEVHLHKIKAMMGVLAGAPRELLAHSWHMVCSPAVRRVTATGDLDLLALLLLYDRRARSMPHCPNPPEGANVGAADPGSEEGDFEEQQDGGME